MIHQNVIYQTVQNIIAYTDRIALLQMEHLCNEIQRFERREDSSLKDIGLFCAEE